MSAVSDDLRLRVLLDTYRAPFRVERHCIFDANDNIVINRCEGALSGLVCELLNERWASAGALLGENDERGLTPLSHVLPAGWKFTPLYRVCPRCGCDLTQQHIDPKNDKRKTKDDENDSERTVVAQMSADNAAREVGVIRKQSCLQGMVDPLAETNKEATERHERGWGGWKFWKQSGAGKDEDESAKAHNDFVPVVKRKLGERVFHWLFGRG